MRSLCGSGVRTVEKGSAPAPATADGSHRPDGLTQSEAVDPPDWVRDAGRDQGNDMRPRTTHRQMLGTQQQLSFFELVLIPL